MLLATLGTFEFLLGKTDWQSFRRQIGEKFVEHQKLEGKPTLQKVGGTLSTINVSILLHPFIIDVRQNQSRLEALLTNGTPEPLVIARNYYNLWVVTGIVETYRNIDTKTTHSTISYELVLKEFFGQTIETRTGQTGVGVNLNVFDRVFSV